MQRLDFLHVLGPPDGGRIHSGARTPRRRDSLGAGSNATKVKPPVLPPLVPCAQKYDIRTNRAKPRLPLRGRQSNSSFMLRGNWPRPLMNVWGPNDPGIASSCRRILQVVPVVDHVPSHSVSPMSLAGWMVSDRKGTARRRLQKNSLPYKRTDACVRPLTSAITLFSWCRISSPIGPPMQIAPFVAPSRSDATVANHGTSSALGRHLARRWRTSANHSDARQHTLPSHYPRSGVVEGPG